MLKPIIVTHQLAKFNSHHHCGSGDIMVSVCHAMLQNQVSKGSYEELYYGQVLIRVSYHPAKFRGHRNSGSRVITLLV